jgi:hypothetical protein
MSLPSLFLFFYMESETMALEYLLAQTRIQAIIDEISDVRQRPENLLWVNRIPSVPALDEEILGRYTGRTLVADLVGEDQVAVVRAPQPIRLTQTKIPKLKHGEKITEKQIGLMSRIESNLASARERSIFDDYIANSMMLLKNGVLHRMEAIHNAMLIDAFSYSKLGIIISGLTWGMPSDLKVLIGTAWSISASATPVSDLLAVKRIASEKYGLNLNRVTMTTTDFVEMITTAQFRDAASALRGWNLTSTGNTIPTDNIDLQRDIASMVLGGMIIEINDRQYWDESTYGVQTATNFQPVGKIIMTSTAGDDNRSYWDWANGELAETVVDRMFGGALAMESGDEGPLAYATVGDPNLNPPGPVLWGAGRGWSRKHMEAASAVLTNP